MSLTLKTALAIDATKPPLSVKDLLDSIDYKIDALYIDRFWDSIENDKWIYIGGHMLDWIGYDNRIENKPKERYLYLISKHFQDEQDYMHLTATQAKHYFSPQAGQGDLPPDFNTHNKAKHLILSPDCFKESLMLIETSKAKQIRKYYIEVEKIFKFYLKYQNEYQKLKQSEIENQLQQEKNKNTNLLNTAIDCSLLQKKEYLYIATTAAYARQNSFKIGKTLDLKQRLSAYNTSHNIREPYYYVYISPLTYQAKAIEYTLKHVLSKFRNSETNEIYCVNFEFLKKMVDRICHNHNDVVDYYNETIADHMNNINNIANIPVDVWNQESVAQEEPTKEVEYDGQMCKVELFDNNYEYEFIRFQTKDKNFNFRCNRCNFIFNRKDQLQTHFHRKIKCFDRTKQERLDDIKGNKADPTVKHYRDNADYGYTETFNDEQDCIQYNCTRCEYSTINYPSLKKHFDRKIKCFEVKTYSNNNIEIEYINGNQEKAYYRYDKSGLRHFHCNHCDYESEAFANLRRHLFKKKLCYQ